MNRNNPRMPRDPLPGESEGPSQRTIAIAVLVFVVAVVVLGAVLIRGATDDGNGGDTAATFPTSTPGSTPAIEVPTDEPTQQQTTETSPSGTPTQSTPSAGGATPTSGAVGATPTPVPAQPTEPAPTDPPAPAPTATPVPPPPPTNTPPPPAPTSELEEPPTQAAEPPIGDFGQLPPAQLPSGGAASQLSLSYQLGMSLENLPASATTYRIEWPVYSREEVQAAAERLGLIGQVVEEGVGIYRVESDRGSLYVSPNEIIYRAAGFGTGNQLPDNATAISTGQEWLAASQFVGSNLSSGVVIGRDPDAQRVVVRFRPTAPSPNLAPTPSATLNIGPGAVVLEARIHWPASLISSAYGLRAPLNLWQTVQNGLGYLTADLSAVSASGPLSGTATITDYSIAYTIAGSPMNEQFLVPVIRFNGTARIEQTGEQIPVSISVPAVYHQSNQFG